MDPCFHVLYAKFWPYHLNVAAEIETHQTRQRFFQSSIVQFWWTCVNCSLRVLFLADRSSTRCGLLLQGSMCCVFRDGILHTLIITSGYLSFCCLSIISNQSAHSPLTSTRHFRPHICHSLDIFFFPRAFSVNPRDGCAWRSQKISSFWNTQTSPSGTNNHHTYKVT